MHCNYWYFKNVGVKCELHVYNKCDDILMTTYKLKKHYKIEREAGRF